MDEEKNCINLYCGESESTSRVNCPVCGRFLKWDKFRNEYSCKCNGIITLQGSGSSDKDEDEYHLAEYDRLPIRICKKPQYYKNHEIKRETIIKENESIKGE